MKTIHPLTRRVVLRGLGATICLPLLEAFLPSTAHAAEPVRGGGKPAKRLIFLSYSWGVSRDDWFPQKAGREYELSTCLQPLARHQADFCVLSNLSNKRATQGHWATTTWLTSADVTATPGKQFQNTVSVDQVAARHLGVETRFPSIELSNSVPGDGYGPGSSLSWGTSGNSIAGETSPVAFFDRLFGTSEVPLAERKYRIDHDRSVLDAVMTDAKSMHRQISKNDREKIDGYFDSVRDIEVRLKKSEEWLDRPKPKAPLARPEGKLNTIEEITVMYDLMIAAIQTDMTRVITYRQPVEGLFTDLGYKVVGHSTTHCTTKSEAYRASIARDQKQAELLSHLIDGLKALKEPDGSSIFQHTMIAYGSGVRTNHDVRDTPTLLAGHGGGGVKQGQHLVFESKQTPLANLWLGMLKQVGVDTPRFADSDGMLPGLFA